MTSGKQRWHEPQEDSLRDELSGLAGGSLERHAEQYTRMRKLKMELLQARQDRDEALRKILPGGRETF